MKLTKQLEKEVRKVYMDYWDRYMRGDPSIIEFLGDNVQVIGSTESEVYRNKKEATDFFISSGGEIAGKVEFRNRNIDIKPLNGYVLIIEMMDLYVLIEKEWVFYAKARLSSLFEKQQSGWKLIQLHGSLPDSRIQGEETISFESINKENQELREAVKRRTIELENKNRELEIEASLERVRMVAMAMKKPDELLDICEALFNELNTLGFLGLRNALINTFGDDDDQYFNDYDYSDFSGGQKGRVAKSGHSVVEEYISRIQAAGEVFSETVVEGEELTKWKEFRRANGEIDDPRLDNIPALYYYIYAFGTAGIGISTFNPIPPDKLEVLKRFRNVFEFAYRRYMDVAQAEAQAQEARIESSLERMRAVAMGMRKSEEVIHVCEAMYKELSLLGFTNVRNAQIAVETRDSDKYMIYVYSDHEVVSMLEAPYESSPIVSELYEELSKSKDAFYQKEFTGEKFEDWRKWRESVAPFKDSRDLTATSICFYLYSIGKGHLGISTFNAITKEQVEIVKRFKNVFELSYQRHLDVTKAEAQAREAQIELALERVRARSMAMQRSDELAEAAQLLYNEFGTLGINTFTCGYMFIDEPANTQTAWVVLPDGTLLPNFIVFPLTGDDILDNRYKSWKRKEPLHVADIQGEVNKEHHLFLSKHVPTTVVEEIFSRIPDRIIFYSANFSDGYLLILATDRFSVDDEKTIIRFATVFEQTYTRFLDLQKAEEQARESQIETALERVRSRTMAMQRSDELSETAAVLFSEFKKLGNEDLIQATIALYQEDEGLMEFRVTNWSGDGEQVSRPFMISISEPTLIAPLFRAWKEKKKTTVVDLSGEQLERWLTYRGTVIGNASGNAENGERRVVTAAFFSKGHFSLSTPNLLPDESVRTLERFAGVFDGTYTRFLDLKKAEAQARESMIEAALERLRSRTLAMQKSDELPQTASVMFKQLILLGIEPNRLYIAIIEDRNGGVEFWITDENAGKVSTGFRTNLNDNRSLRKMLDAWKENKKSLSLDMQGEELQEYFDHLSSLNVPFKRGPETNRRVQNIAFFSQGFIGIASPHEQPKETILLLERFAAAFNLTYTRFNDLKVAEAHAIQAAEDLVKLQTEKKRAEDALNELQAAQKQLIQSEKMASLGELTAGIAHEIQNPLNFVNNFSEVSNELLDEMIEEVNKGNFDEVKEILSNVRQNLEKIYHHGKRADGIVKGMLQHSRTSTGQKEPTDMNVLADEYLRLAFHGLRAKDKSFNAIMKTDYDNSLGKVNIIPQDIGRVILNLISNAFYVVNEKSKRGIAGYEPTVTVSTKRLTDHFEIKVEDNGDGIPKKVLDKIFQPFFTTKPTGQGTGLGLSLSYDIVKAHDGEFHVKTQEGEGTEFIIHLPF